VSVTVRGIGDVNRILGEIAPREAVNLMRSTVHDVAGKVAKAAKADMSIDEGKMKRGTKAKRRRGSRDKVQSDVIVQGAFYWRFLEYGQGPDGVEYAMFLKALQAMRPEMSRIYVESFAKKLIARLKRERNRAV
jgi:hypothetical protein